MRILAILILVGSTARAGAVEYANTDSITVHGLTFIGAIDRYSYALGDSIRTLYRVANRSAEPISFETKSECDGFVELKTWCDSTYVCDRPLEFRLCISRNEPWTVVIPPGETRIVGYAHPPRRSTPGFHFAYGVVGFYNPWDGLPFAFYLR